MTTKTETESRIHTGTETTTSLLGRVRPAAAALLALLAVPACLLDGEEGLAPGEMEIELSQGAVTSVNHCATGENPNAIGHLGLSDSYSRNTLFTTTAGCSTPRATTIVDFNGVSNTRYRFNMTATIAGAQFNASRCLQSLVAMRTLKSNGAGGWIEINYKEAPTTIQANGSCFGGLQYVVPTAQFAGNGDYRVRVRAVRWNGTFETVSLIGALWQ